MKKDQFESMIRKNIPDIVSCGSSVEDFEKFGKDYYAVISDLINQMTVTGLKMNLSYTSSKYHTKVSFFKWSISARGFSGLGPGIDKRFFVSCSELSLVSRKNKDFCRK